MGSTFTAESLGIDVEQVEARLGAGLNLPSHCYTDPHIHDFEMAAIFDRSWQYFAPRARLLEPGTVVIGDIGRTPVIVSRSDDGVLRGFVNACRHRGYRLLDADTRCSRIQCAYHSWIYGLDGVLARAPKAEHDRSIVPGELALHAVSVAEWGHAVWVNPDPTAPDFLDAHPGLDDAADRLGLDHDLDRYVPYSRSVTTQAANWKLWYDNGTECYHCPTVHRDSFGAAYDTVNGFSEQFFAETFSGSHFAPAEPADDRIVAGGYASFQSFPGTQYIQQAGVMIMARAIPTGAAEMTFVADYLAERGTPVDQVDEWVKLWDQTYAEDAGVVEQIQRNLESGRVTELRYVDGLEDASRYFHDLIWASYRAALDV